MSLKDQVKNPKEDKKRGIPSIQQKIRGIGENLIKSGYYTSLKKMFHPNIYLPKAEKYPRILEDQFWLQVENLNK